MKKLISMLLAVIMCVSLCTCLIPAANAHQWYVCFAKGNTVRLGTYEQDGRTSNGKESLYWRVLDIDEQGVLLVTNYVIDQIDYDNNGGELTWEDCSLRTWLNTTFFSEAFTAEEQGLIADSVVTADENAYYGRQSGNDTTDKVFLLSTSELRHYFPTKESRVGYPTQYLMNKGAWYDKDTLQCWYTTRTPGMDDSRVALVHWEGDFFWRGDKTDSANPIRPALRLSFDALEQYAKTLNPVYEAPDICGQRDALVIPYDTVWLSGDDTTYVGKTSYKRLSWMINSGKNFGLTSASYREEVTLLGTVRGIDGETNYLVRGQDGYWFWVTESRLRSTP